MTQTVEPTATRGFLRVSCHSSNAEVRVALTGDLDIATVAQLDQVLRDAQADADVVVLDLRGLRFMGCSGVEVILAADDRAQAAGGRLVVVRAPSEVERLFALVAIDHRLDIVDQPPGDVRPPALQDTAVLDAA